MYPEELICHYYVDIIDVKNLGNADLRIDGTISTMAGGFLPGQMKATAEPVSHTFTLSPNEELTTLSSNFLTFGVPDGVAVPHYISIYVALKNRSGNVYTFDVSDQVNQAPDPRNVHITIRGFELPDLPPEPPGPSSGGMGASIDNWNSITYEISM